MDAENEKEEENIKKWVLKLEHITEANLVK